MIFSDFRPAEYHAGKSSYVAFYVINPETGTLVRKRIKVNRVGRGQNRDRYARTLCCEINRKLYEGWNPFLENDAYFSGTSMQERTPTPTMQQETYCRTLRRNSLLQATASDTTTPTTVSTPSSVLRLQSTMFTTLTEVSLHRKDIVAK